MRYKVATCEGFPITPRGAKFGTNRPGLTASVLDTHIIHREVARFRSEDRRALGRGLTLGREGALRAAREYADALNAKEAARC